MTDTGRFINDKRLVRNVGGGKAEIPKLRAVTIMPRQKHHSLAEALRRLQFDTPRLMRK